MRSRKEKSMVTEIASIKILQDHRGYVSACPDGNALELPDGRMRDILIELCMEFRKRMNENAPDGRPSGSSANEIYHP